MSPLQVEESSPQSTVPPQAEPQPPRWSPFRRFFDRLSGVRTPAISERLENLATFILRIGTLLLIVLALIFVARSLRDQGYLIEPLTVPEELAKAGYTGEVVAISILEQVKQLKLIANSVKVDSTQLVSSDAPDLDLNVLGIGLSLRSVNYHLRELLGRDNRVLRGYITHLDSTYRLTLYMTGYAALTREVRVGAGGSVEAIDRLMQLGGEAVLYNTDPYRLAVVYYRQNRLEEAKATIRYYIRTRPAEAAWAQLAWGSMLQKEQNYPAACQKFARATELDPTLESAWVNLAWCRQRLQELGPARAALNRAIQISPDDPSLYNQMAWLLFQQGDHPAADSVFDLASKRFPTVDQVWVSWADSKLSRGDHQAAVALLDRISDTLQENANSYSIRAMAIFASGDTAKALKYLRTAHDLEPENSVVANILIRIAYQQQNYAEILQLAERANVQTAGDKDWTQQSILNYSAMAYNGLGQHKQAMQTARRSIAIDTAQGYPYSTLGETFVFLNQLDSFYHYLQISLDKGMPAQFINLEVSPYNRLRRDDRLLNLLREAQQRQQKTAASLAN